MAREIRRIVRETGQWPRLNQRGCFAGGYRSSEPPSPSGRGPAVRRPARSVTVNLAESPLGWLFARGFVTRNQ